MWFLLRVSWANWHFISLATEWEVGASIIHCVSLSSLQLYAVAVKDLIKKTDKIYKVKTRNSTVEYTIKKLEPGGKYHIIVQLGNMSKESSMKINTGKERVSTLDSVAGIAWLSTKGI